MTINITLKLDEELNNSIVRSAERENRSRHNYIIHALKIHQNGESNTGFFSMKLTEEQKIKLKKELGL